MAAAATTTTTVSRMERLKMQRDEWESCICVEMCDVVENMLRDMYQAAVMVAKAKGHRNIDVIFGKIVEKLPSWSDQELLDEFGNSVSSTFEERTEKAGRIEEYIKNVVWSQATLMSISCGKVCKDVIRAPNALSFLRMVVNDVAMDHDPMIFGSSDMRVRSELKTWISASIKRKLLSIIPIKIFTITEIVPVLPAPAVAEITETVISPADLSNTSTTTTTVDTPAEPSKPQPAIEDKTEPVKIEEVVEEAVNAKETEPAPNDEKYSGAGTSAKSEVLVIPPPLEDEKDSDSDSKSSVSSKSSVEDTKSTHSSISGSGSDSGSDSSSSSSDSASIKSDNDDDDDSSSSISSKSDDDDE